MTFIIRHRGFFNYSELQRAIRGWFLEEGFHSVDIPLYKQKGATALGVEHEFEVSGWKNENEYVRFTFSVFCRVYDLRDIEIIREGKKVELQDGKVLIRITPDMSIDYAGRFKGSKLREFLGTFMEKYILRYKIGDYWEDILWDKASQLSRLMRETLGQEVL